jgi:DNA-binding CsgD family transcriptional regulator
VLCIIDDAQWVDPESLNVLAFVGRRLRAEGVALIFGYRTFDTASPVLAGIPDLPVAGLPEPAAIELLATTVQDRLDAATARRIVTETSGCPLALTELAGHLTAEQLTGTEPLPEPMPISSQLEAHFRRRVERLPAGTQLFLLVAATETSGDSRLVRQVARELGCEHDDEELAIRQRLIVADPLVEFRHPLIRSAIYAGANPAERRAVHRALAGSIDKSKDPDRWARHLALTATGPDDQLADDLEAAARRARDRGGYAAEASLLIQAAELTEQPQKRSARLLEASVAALNSGAAVRAESLLAQARPGLVDPKLLAEALDIEGRLCWPLSRTPDAAALHLEAASQLLPLDADRARYCLRQAIETYVTSQHFTEGITGAEIAEVVLATPVDVGAENHGDLLLNGTALLISGRYPEAVELLRRAGRLLNGGSVPSEEIPDWLFSGMFMAGELMDDRLYLAWAEQVEGVARRQGALLTLQTSLLAFSEHHVRAGQFQLAAARFAEVIELSAAMGLDIELYIPTSATLLSWQGNNLEARAMASRLINDGIRYGVAVPLFMGYRALAILELAGGNYAAALQAAQCITSEEALGWQIQALPLVVEAAIRSSNREVAERALVELHIRATATATPWALGLLARSQALVADESEAEALFVESISQLGQTLIATDLALAHLSYGEWLRRQGRRVDARAELRTAHHMLESMGAGGFAERARTELLATGERVARRSAKRQSDLTPQELQIAQLASRGATNPEIAMKLFLSASTVDYHLRKVYRKLGITSRRQLEQTLASA